MGAISGGNLTLLRERKDTQKTVERLYTPGFVTMWTGRIDDSGIARGAQTVVYDTGSLVAGFVFADLVAGLEIWVGSSAGAYDKGKRRILSISGAEAAGTFILDWNDDIDFADDDHLTIKHFYAPWPKYSWFTTTGPDFRKDGPPAASGGAGIDYVDQNEEPPPLVVMGRNYANELIGANLVVQLNASSSQAVADAAAISTYAWTVTPSAGATFSNSAIANPTITFTTEAVRWVSVTVTDDNGNASTGHRAYVIGGGLKEFGRTPITTLSDNAEIQIQITLTSPDTSDSDAIRPEVDWSVFEDHGLIIITAEDDYGDTSGTISFRDGAVYTDHQHIVFSGYLILENDDLIDDGSGRYQMTAVSTLSLFLYSLSLTGEHSPTDWYEMAKEQMDVAHNLFHLFYWQSTLLDIMDWWLPWSDTTKRSANELFTEGNILEKARSLIRSRLMAMTATPQGEVYVEANLNLQDQVTRDAETTTLTLVDNDITGTKRARVRNRGDLVRVLTSGGSSVGLLGTFVPHLSASHDVARAEGRPSLRTFDRLMLASQTESNNFAGRLAQISNAKYQEVVLDFSGNYREVFSPADQQWTNLGNIFAGSLAANLRGNTDLESVKCVPRQVTHTHDNATGNTTVNMIAEIEATEGLTGVTLPIPEVPSEDIGDGNFDPPDPPAWPILPPGTTLPYNTTGTLFLFDDTNGCYIRRPTDTDWTVRNGLLSGTDIQDQQGGFDPWWQTPEKTGSTNIEVSIIWKLDVGKIFRSTDGGTSWNEVTPAADPPNTFGDSPAPEVADLTFICRTDNIHDNQAHYFMARWTTGGAERGWLLKTEDDGATWVWGEVGTIIDGGDGWFYGGDVNFFCTGQGGSTWPYANATNAIGIDDGSVATFTKTAGADPLCPAGFQQQVTIDFGAEFSGSVNFQAKTSGDLANRFPDVFFSNTAAAFDDPTDPSWTNLGSNAWYTLGGTLTWSGNITPGGGPWRYVMVKTDGEIFEADGLAQQIDAFRIQGTVTIPELQPIWMDTDTEDGTVLWMTLWTDADKLWLEKRSTSTLLVIDRFDLGAATEAQLDAKTYIAFPFTPAFNKEVCYVYGRMNAPQSLANPEHLIETLDDGSSFTSIENGFAADHIGALQAWESGANWQIVAVRNVIAGSTGQFYSGLNTGALALQGATPIQVGQDALTIKDSNYAIGGLAAVGGEILDESTDGGATWNDITDSFPVDGEIKSLIYV